MSDCDDLPKPKRCLYCLEQQVTKSYSNPPFVEEDQYTFGTLYIEQVFECRNDDCDNF